MEVVGEENLYRCQVPSDGIIDGLVYLPRDRALSYETPGDRGHNNPTDQDSK